jgi:hypothetical protein
LLSNKRYFVFLFAALVFISCGENEKNENPPISELNDSEIILAAAKKIFGKNVQNIITGNYTDTSKQFVVLTETITPEIWGISFNLMVRTSTGFDSVFQSALLPGSFKDSEVRNIKLPEIKYDLVYYNSRNYFMGSGGGEIFSYIIDFNLKQTYYAHLIAEGDRPVSLFISHNTNVQKIKDTFINAFTKDYPALTIINEDIKLE